MPSRAASYPVNKLTIEFDAAPQAPGVRKPSGELDAMPAPGEPGGFVISTTLPPKLVVHFKALLEAANVPPERWLPTLENVICLYQALCDRLAPVAAQAKGTGETAASPVADALASFRFAEAESMLQRAVVQHLGENTRMEALPEDKKLAVARIQADLGDIRYVQMDFEGAKARYREAAQWVPEPETAFKVECLQRWGNAALSLGHHAEADLAFRLAIEAQESR